MTRREVRHLMEPWLGLVVGLTAWAFTHQLGADGMFDDCKSFAPVPIVLAAVAGIMASVIAGWFSWRIVSNGKQAHARRVIATVSVGMAALFVLAMVYPIFAVLIIPPCFQ